MSRAITLTKPMTIGHQTFPAGITVNLAEKDADDAVLRGLGGEAATTGIATITNGTAVVTINHGLGAMPAAICVTGTHAEVQSCIVTAATPVSFTISTGAGTNVTADRRVYWEVRK
jgi:hypothetical protein